MPNYTTNYNLTKPLGSELYSIDVQNDNMDKIDAGLKSVEGSFSDSINQLNSSISSLQSSVTSLDNADSTLNTRVTRVENVNYGRNFIVDTKNGFQFTNDGSSQQTYYAGNVANSDVANYLFGKKVTISFDWEHSVTSGNCIMSFQYTWQGIKIIDSTTAASGHYSSTFDLNEISTPSTNNSMVYLQGTFTGTITITNMKLEVGDKATEWCEATEDYVNGLMYNVETMLKAL